MIQKNRIQLESVIFTIVILSGLLTVAPGIYVGDAGELVTAAYSLGVGHPPGYPLFYLAGRIFAWLNMGSIAFRINLVSVFFAALAAAFFYRLMSGWVSRTSAFAAALCLAFSKIFWQQTIQAEVYTMNVFFVVLTLNILKQWTADPRRKRLLYLLAFVYAVSLTGHYTMFLLGPAYLIWILLVHRKNNIDIKQVNLLFLSLCFLAGLLIYLYIPIRALANPAINWGNPVTPSSFWNHISRRQYGELSLASRSWVLCYTQLVSYMKILAEQFSPVLFLVVLSGIFKWFKERNLWLVFTLISFVCTGFGVFVLLNPKINAHDLDSIEPFLLPSIVFCAIWLGAGVDWITGLIGRKMSRLAVWMACLVPAVPLITNYSLANQSRNYLAFAYGLDIMKTPEPGSMVFLAGDNSTFIVKYLQSVEKRHREITFADDAGVVFENIYGADYPRLPDAEHNKRMNQIQRKVILSGRQVYYTLGSNLQNMEGISVKPCGLFYRVLQAGEKYEIDEGIWPGYRTGQINTEGQYYEYLAKDVLSHYHYARAENLYSSGKIDSAKEEYRLAGKTGWDVNTMQNLLAATFMRLGMPDEALTQLRESLILNPGDPDIHNSLGNIYLAKKMNDQAINEFEKALGMNSKLPEAYNNLGIAWLAKGSISQAEKAFKNAVKLRPNDQSLYNNLGMAYFNFGMNEEASAAYSKAIEVNPLFEPAYHGLGNVYLKTGKYEKAISAYLEAVKLNPAKTITRNNLGIAYFNSGKREDAVAQWKAVLKIDPENDEAKNYMKQAEEKSR